MFNKRTKLIVSVVLAVVLLMVFVVSYLAPFIVLADTTQDKINKAQNEKNQIQNKIAEATEKKQGVLSVVSDIDAQIAVIQGEIDGLQSEIDDCNRRINDAENQIAECEIQEKKQYESMKKRLRVMYEDNNTSYITMIFGSDTLNDILSYIEIIKQIINHDNNMYNRIIETKEQVKELKAEIEEEKKGIQDKKSVVDSKKADLDVEVDKMNTALKEINGNLASLRAAYDEAEREEAALKRQLQAELSGSTTSASFNGGTFAWPTPGYGTITSQYGGRMHPTLKVYKVHTGMDIGAPSGAKVVAGADGTVVKAEYNVAYGNYIVINHGNGYSTLYAHNSVLSVKKGDFVVRGQTIAKVGSTGYSTGPHCHFEVMINGQHTDPMPYLK